MKLLLTIPLLALISIGVALGKNQKDEKLKKMEAQTKHTEVFYVKHVSDFALVQDCSKDSSIPESRCRAAKNRIMGGK